ncbi:hypothetical protein WYO_0154 [Methylobacterium sp. GXF4]|uniref:hypothetical protein n=1 Tax=Methylobacterium sp. GXF4 TaxID=1096546 RepID=UPI0002698C43|nr:hypothetical protein [Methylobacterium sp. GXF4]EIZ87117.1 hypothetical protein WYO_0154 [Methylobacterium sp. GXF4]
MNTATFTTHHAGTNGHASLDDLLDLGAEPFTAPQPSAQPVKRKGKAPSPAQPSVVLAPVVSAPAPEPQDQPEPAIISLADDTLALTRRLARSLGMPITTDAPAPSAFVAAIEKIHAGLTQARGDLGTWADELAERERALLAREKAVQRREDEAAASLALARLAPPTGRPAQRLGFLARLFKRRG